MQMTRETLINLILTGTYMLIPLWGILGFIGIAIIPNIKHAYYAGLSSFIMLLLGLALGAIVASINHIYRVDLLYMHDYVQFTKEAAVVGGLVALVFIYEIMAISALLEKAGIEVSRYIVSSTLLLELLLQAVIVMPCLWPYYSRFQNIITALVIFVGLACLRNKKIFQVGFPGIILIFGAMVMVLVYIQIYIGY